MKRFLFAFLFLTSASFTTQIEAVRYCNDPVYIYSDTYHGFCGLCGWPRDENGACTNPTCHSYGPNRD